jgi:hypothetical protein
MVITFPVIFVQPDDLVLRPVDEPKTEDRLHRLPDQRQDGRGSEPGMPETVC